MAETLMTLLGNYCFPIVMCLLMAWIFYDQNTKHAEESKSMSDAINAMTNAINELTIYIKELK